MSARLIIASTWIIAVLVTAIAWWPSVEGKDSSLKGVEPESIGEDSREFHIDDPAWIDRLKEGRRERFENQVKGSKSRKNLGETQGVADPGLKRELTRREINRLQRQIRQANERINSMSNIPGYGTDLELMAKEADRLRHVTLLEACLRAAQAGDFVIVKGRNTFPMTMPDAHVVRGSRNYISGTRYTTIYVLRQVDHPNFFAASDYRAEVVTVSNNERVRAFNALPLNERKAWIEDVDRFNSELAKAGDDIVKMTNLQSRSKVKPLPLGAIERTNFRIVPLKK